MRFEVALLRDKLNPIQLPLRIIAQSLKKHQETQQFLFLYVAQQRELRILFHRQETPIILVLENSMISSVVSLSKHANNTQNVPCTMGFIVKNGQQLIDNLLMLCCHQLKIVSSEEENTIKFKISKQRNFRYLEIKVPNFTTKLEIQKPKTNEAQLFSYRWIDGVLKHKAFFQLNPTHFLQLLNPIQKYQGVYPFQNLQQKLVRVEINLNDKYLKASVKTITSEIITQSNITIDLNQDIFGEKALRESQMEEQGVQVKKQYQRPVKTDILHYEIKFSDCQQISNLLKGETSFIIDQSNKLAIQFNHEGTYQCQFSVAQLIKFLKAQGPGDVYLKIEENQQPMEVIPQK